MISKETLKEYTGLVGRFVGIIFITSLLHWIFAQIYIKYCIRSTFTGMFTHVFTLGSPFCQFINYMQFELSRYYITIWAAAAIGLITWFVTKAK
tara:strand:+ start:65 stop:346 length:282 start_codon:yes stop_codon:yes gene_type:complete